MRQLEGNDLGAMISSESDGASMTLFHTSCPAGRRAGTACSASVFSIAARSATGRIDPCLGLPFPFSACGEGCTLAGAVSSNASGAFERRAAGGFERGPGEREFRRL
jgi:hypothetical protein